MVKVGIDLISFYTSNTYLDLNELAEARGVDVNKYYVGIGQERMSIPTPDEDVVTMGANAAQTILNDCDKSTIGTVIFATESSIDQSKAAGIFIHDLLDLPKDCRVVEVKQACYSATAALQMACGLVTRTPNKSILIIASDIARYDLDSPGEATQGCGAVALLVKQDPRILEVSEHSGCYTQNNHDFWRPNYRTTPIVNGKSSTLTYIKAARKCWKALEENAGLEFDDIEQFCYHLPFTNMANKAHLKVARDSKSEKDKSELLAQLEPSLVYNRKIGNSYSASTYISFCSLLDHCKTLENQKVGIFAFGSGSVGEFFYGTVVAGYQKWLYTSKHQAIFEKQQPISFQKYLTNHGQRVLGPEDITLQQETSGNFTLRGIKDQHRVYQQCQK